MAAGKAGEVHERVIGGRLDGFRKGCVVSGGAGWFQKRLSEAVWFHGSVSVEPVSTSHLTPLYPTGAATL